MTTPTTEPKYRSNRLRDADRLAILLAFKAIERPLDDFDELAEYVLQATGIKVTNANLKGLIKPDTLEQLEMRRDQIIRGRRATRIDNLAKEIQELAHRVEFLEEWITDRAWTTKKN